MSLHVDDCVLFGCSIHRYTYIHTEYTGVEEVGWERHYTSLQRGGLRAGRAPSPSTVSRGMYSLAEPILPHADSMRPESMQGIYLDLAMVPMAHVLHHELRHRPINSPRG